MKPQYILFIAATILLPTTPSALAQDNWHNKLIEEVESLPAPHREATKQFIRNTLRCMLSWSDYFNSKFDLKNLTPAQEDGIAKMLIEACHDGFASRETKTPKPVLASLRDTFSNPTARTIIKFLKEESPQYRSRSRR